MTYKLENIPEELDRAIRARAAAEHKSPEQAILDELSRGFAVSAPPQKHGDLSDIAGTWEETPESDDAQENQRRTDSETCQADASGQGDQAPAIRRDLSDVAGMCSIDDKTRSVFRDLRRIDPELWK